MYPAINGWAFPDVAEPARQIELAAAAGFEGLELTVNADGALTPETPASAFRILAEQAAERGLKLPSLACALYWQFNYASRAEDDRVRARDLTMKLLDQAAAAGAGAILVVPAVVGKAGDASPQVSYADALARTVDALMELRHEAEARAVTIGIENVWNRFLLSPIEAAELIDRINSPYVQFYFDTGNVLAFGYPEDWVATLGGRIACVHAKDYDVSKAGWDGFCEIGEGSVNWTAVVAGLREGGFDGALTYEGTGEAGMVCRRLKNIIAGRPPQAVE